MKKIVLFLVFLLLIARIDCVTGKAVYSENDPPSITSQPSDTTVNAGDSIALQISAAGATPISFQWYKNGTAIQYATSNIYVIDSVAPADTGTYFCIATNNYGSASSDTVLLLIKTKEEMDLVPDFTDTLSTYCKCNPLIKNNCICPVITIIPDQRCGLLSVYSEWWIYKLDEQGQQTADSVLLHKVDIQDNPNARDTFDISLCDYLSTYDYYEIDNCYVLKHLFTTNGRICPDSTGKMLFYADTFCLRGTPKARIAGDTILCKGEISELRSFYYYPPQNNHFKWTGCNILTSDTISSINVEALTNCIYKLEIENDYGCRGVDSVQINPSAPDIIVQPVSDTLCPGDSAQLYIYATGRGALKYQWCNQQGPIAGASNHTYYTTIPDKYICYVQDSLGCITASDTAVVSNFFYIYKQPKDTMICIGGTAKFTVLSNENQYQWQRNGSNIQGATNDTLLIENADYINEAYYNCIISSTQSQCPIVSTDTVYLNIIQAPIVSALPLSYFRCENTELILTVNAISEVPASYQWYKNGNLLQGETNDSLFFTPLDTADGGVYYCKVTNICGQEQSSNKNIFVLALPQVEAPVYTVCMDSANSIGVFTVQATNVSAYQWIYNGTDISGATASSYIPPAKIDDEDVELYRCRVRNTCDTILSSPAVLHKFLPVIIEDKTVNISICEGLDTTLIAVAEGNELSYIWKKFGETITGVTGSTYQIDSLTRYNEGYYTCIAGNHCFADTINFIVTAKFKPILNIASLIQEKSIGDSVSWYLSPGGTGPFLYEWMQDDVIIQTDTIGEFTIDSISCEEMGIYKCRVSNECGYNIQPISTLNVDSCGIISGKVTYDNVAQTELHDIKVRIVKVGTTDTLLTVTNDTGYYAFKVPRATYYMRKGESRLKWQGSDPIDALFIKRHYIGLYKIQGTMKSLAADVNDNKKIDPIDALMINRRFLGILKKFNINVKDYIFVNDTTLVLNSAGISYNFPTICAGDVNGSATAPFITLAKKMMLMEEEEPAMPDTVFACTIKAGVFAAQADSIISLPVYAYSLDSAGAFGCKLQYDTTALSFLGIVNVDTALTDLLYARADSSLNIAWVAGDTALISLDSARLFDIRFRYNAGYTALDFLPESMAADRYCNYFDATFVNGFVGPVSPLILTQPADTANCEGGGASLSLSATGADTLLYSWYKIVDNQSSLIDSSANSTLSIQNLALTDAGSYYCIVSNNYGSASSDTVSLIVFALPVINTQPVSDTICEGSEVSFSVSASGAQPLSFQWYKDDYLLDDATDSLFYIQYVAIYDTGYYKCVVSNACGADTSEAAKLSVRTAPVITEIAYNQYIMCEGDTLLLRAIATGSEPLNYQWTKNGSDIYGATNDSLLIDSITVNEAGYYECKVSNICGETYSYSYFYPTIYALPVITTQPQSDTICEGDYLYLSVETNYPYSYSYQWQKDGEDISGANYYYYEVSSITEADTGAYTCVVTNYLEGCSVTSDTAYVRLKEPDYITLEFYGIWYDALYYISGTLSDNTNFGYFLGDGYVSPNNAAAALAYQMNNEYPQIFTAEYCGNEIVSFRPFSGCNMNIDYENFYTYGANIISNLNPPPCGYSSRLISDNKPVSSYINLYPNPNSGNFDLDLRLGYDTKVDIEVFNITGKRVLSSEFSVKKGSLTKNFELEQPDAEIYFVKIRTDRENFYRKMIVE